MGMSGFSHSTFSVRCSVFHIRPAFLVAGLLGPHAVELVAKRPVASSIRRGQTSIRAGQSAFRPCRSSFRAWGGILGELPVLLRA
jgi:hypothetical protein